MNNSQVQVGSPPSQRHNLLGDCIARIGQFLADNKDTISSVQSLITILAVLVGGVWTYRTSINQRQGHPRLRVEHAIKSWEISNDQVLVSVNEILTNSGPVMVDLPGGSIRIIQVMPLPKHVSQTLPNAQAQPTHAQAESSVYDPDAWDVLVDAKRDWKPGNVVIEPGESDTVPNEFVIPTNVRVLAVYSYISNPDNSKLGWNGITYYDLEEPVEQKVSSSQVGKSVRPQGRALRALCGSLMSRPSSRGGANWLHIDLPASHT